MIGWTGTRVSMFVIYVSQRILYLGGEAMRILFVGCLIGWLMSSLPTSTWAVDEPNKQPLRVLYLARNDEARESAFTEFLAANFVQSSSMKRDQFKPEMAAPYDVVLVDWSQMEIHDPNAQWDSARNYPSPLGDRSRWSTPTVLLGSAGQILAGPWQTIGGAG
jgi:hypothetical protein